MVLYVLDSTFFVVVVVVVVFVVVVVVVFFFEGKRPSARIFPDSSLLGDAREHARKPYLKKEND